MLIDLISFHSLTNDLDIETQQSSLQQLVVQQMRKEIVWSVLYVMKSLKIHPKIYDF